MNDDDPMIGLTVGNYEITQKLAQGGMGVVYQGRHTTLDRPVAIKFLASHFTEEQDYVERFLREAKALAKLNHPNITAVYDAGVTDDVYYLVMEFVSGRDLASILKNVDYLEEKRSLRIIRQAAAALSYAHKEGIIHQDIKPQNILLADEDHVKLCDLGLATWAHEKGESSLLGEGEVMGTPFYVSPEQVLDAKNVDARTDIYSLGATFYHLVSGHPPFRASSNEEIMEMHLNAPYPDPREHRRLLSDGVCYVLQRMLARDLKDRYASMDEVVNDLILLEEGKSPGKKSIYVSEDNDEIFQVRMGVMQRRLQGKTDFPSMSGAIGVITKLVSVTDNTSVNDLAEAILSDFALTNKLLKLVNSVYYSGYGDKIGTVSQAVMVLGLGQVRNAALSLMLFENFQNRSLADEIKESSISNYFSGLIGKNLAIRLRMANREEAFICSIFHNLGKLLVTFYLPEDRKKIKFMLEDDPMMPEEAAVRSVLGKPYEHFGKRVGLEWNFPEQIIFTMDRLVEVEIPKPKTLQAQLHCIVCFSNGISAIMRDPVLDEQKREEAFQNLILQFKNCFPITLEDIAEIIDVAVEELGLFTRSMDMKLDVDQKFHR